MKVFHNLLGVLVLLVWIGVVGCAAGGIWNSGNNPLSDRLGGTALLLFFTGVVITGAWAAMWDIRDD